MIVVIADDLSGAAELAGAAANAGLAAEVQTSWNPRTQAQVIAIDSDTRSLPAEQAADVVSSLTAEVLRSKPDWIYKKTDSVLRGNIRAEIHAILGAIGLQRCLYIPANPSKGRIIREGIYYIHEVPLAQTAFANDIEHPRWSSRVIDLLHASSATSLHPPVRSASAVAPEPHFDIHIPDILTTGDLLPHASACDASTLPAGGVEFFAAMLDAKGSPSRPHFAYRGLQVGPTLLVCGSAQAWAGGRPRECQQLGIPTVAMPANLYHSVSATPAEPWIQQVMSAMDHSSVVMIAIGGTGLNSLVSPVQLTERLIEAVAQILKRRPIARVLLEGGATAAALLREMKWTQLDALPADFSGVAALRANGMNSPLLLIKPGSYPWPTEIWR